MQDSEKPSAEAFGWHDLSGDEVYHIAALEQEALMMVETYLGKLALDNGDTRDAELINDAQNVLTDYEEFAQSWLVNQANFRGIKIDRPELHPIIMARMEWDTAQHGGALKSKREERNLTQRDLAVALGISQSAVHRAEQGAVPSSKAKHPLLHFVLTGKLPIKD